MVVKDFRVSFIKDTSLAIESIITVKLAIKNFHVITFKNTTPAKYWLGRILHWNDKEYLLLPVDNGNPKVLARLYPMDVITRKFGKSARYHLLLNYRLVREIPDINAAVEFSLL